MNFDFRTGRHDAHEGLEHRQREQSALLGRVVRHRRRGQELEGRRRDRRPVHQQIRLLRVVGERRHAVDEDREA